MKTGRHACLPVAEISEVAVFGRLGRAGAAQGQGQTRRKFTIRRHCILLRTVLPDFRVSERGLRPSGKPFFVLKQRAAGVLPAAGLIPVRRAAVPQGRSG